ncbi:golgin subfamily A member 1 [Anabrus simplex]|uniref:golgin subfamily A member 1 n=1 Tax=Anabrus simplex TaxID=316456 RepID=UPI0034DCCBCB
MFASLKNKIKEETGSDLTKLPILNSPPQKLTSSVSKGRHSRQGSGSSLGSLSFDGIAEERASSPLGASRQDSSEGKVLTPKDIKRLEKLEDEWKKKLQRKDDEWAKKLEKKEEEWRKQLEEKQREWNRSLEMLEKEKGVLEEEKRGVVKQKLSLEESLKVAEEYKRKVFQYQEDIDQLEGFQTQEMAKIKHLLLVKEQEVAEKVNALRESSNQVETLRAEVTRLRRYEEELSNLQDELETLRHSSDRERSRLSSNLAQSEEEVRHLRDRVAVLEQRTNAECVGLGAQLNADERVQALLGERVLLERRLEEAHLHLSNIKLSWSEKISSLETQVGRLCRQAAEEGAERRRAENERDALMERIKALEILVDKGKTTIKLKEESLDRLREERDGLVEELKEVRLATDEEISGLRSEYDKAAEERVQLLSQVKETENRVKSFEADYAQLAVTYESEKSERSALQVEMTRLREELEKAHGQCAELSLALDKERQEKDSILMRNAQVSQQMELARQELRVQEQEATELHSKVTSLQEAQTDRVKELDRRRMEVENLSKRIEELEMVEHDKQAGKDLEQELRNSIAELEDQLGEKNKTIRILQQRLGDMKKTLQRELRLPPQSVDGSAGVDVDGSVAITAILTPSSSKQVQPKHSSNHRTKEEEEDVNFKYLKHVLIKFLTSREYEAQHLTRAVATLLRFSPEEERLLRETLDWKMSWFGTRPNLGMGQTAKTIPPS